MKNSSRTCIAMTLSVSLGLMVLTAGCSAGGADVAAGNGNGRGNESRAGFFGRTAHSLPADSVVPVRLNTGLTSGSAALGQEVRAQVAADVMADGQILIPAGSEVTGTVTAVKPAKRFGGQAMVAVGFDSVVLPNGDKLPVTGGMAAYADKQTAKDTGTIVGSTVGGALLGKVLGKDTKHAVAGAVVGGGVGTAVASRKGDEAHLPAGTSTTLRTSRAASLPAV
jgi:hypothetical protein